jgi:hypothetical protein
MHFNQQTPLKKLQQHSCSSLIGLAGVRTGGYMTWINDYPKYTYWALAKLSADSMLLNLAEVWLDAPPQPKHNKNNMQLIVVWNNQGKQALNESNLAWLNNLKQTIPEATWTCNNSAHEIGTARVKCKNKQRKRFGLLLHCC